jgi:oxygen-independent coproporphyrinogen-3 oxidase
MHASDTGPHVSATGTPTASIDIAGAAQQPHFAALPPLSLYVHVPWCVRKCPYCDFNSHEVRGEVPQREYVDALLADLERALPAIWGRKVHTIFIGGGTPSLLEPPAVDALLSGIRARLPLVPGAEVTLEANPGTFERRRFAGYYAAGVNRLSLGVQSFAPHHLAALGRIHDADEARRAAEAALMIFGNVNLDLMYALPAQTLDEARRDVAEAIAFGTPHLSFYQLTLEPNTLFHRKPPAMPGEDEAADIEEAVHAALAAAGYGHYETSAFARPGRECAHNLNYWRFGDYLGIGAGAHSKISSPGRIERELRYKQPRQYLEQVARGEPVQERHAVPRDEVGFEFMLNALRLNSGVPASLFAERTGYPLALVARTVDEAVRRGLMDDEPQWLRATPLGRRFLSDLQALFLPARRRVRSEPVQVHARS